MSEGSSLFSVHGQGQCHGLARAFSDCHYLGEKYLIVGKPFNWRRSYNLIRVVRSTIFINDWVKLQNIELPGNYGYTLSEDIVGPSPS